MRPSLLLPLLLAAAGCGNECSFHEQCDGAILQICGEGPDQMFGRQVHETDCTTEALDGTCVEIDDQSAACASAPLETCDIRAHTPTCEGEIIEDCFGVSYTTAVDYPTGYLARRDCTADGGTCVETANGAACEPVD